MKTCAFCGNEGEGIILRIVNDGGEKILACQYCRHRRKIEARMEKKLIWL